MRGDDAQAVQARFAGCLVGQVGPVRAEPEDLGYDLPAMAVEWTKEQAELVQQALDAYPVESGRCESCAIAVRGVGLQVDEGTHCLSVRPSGRERFVVPKANPHGERWYYHFTTSVSSHCVDVLTSVPGTATALYLDMHWKYPEALEIRIEEPSDG